MNFKLSKTHQVYFVAALISVLLSALTIYHYPVFNGDGVLYFKTATAFWTGGIKAAIVVYGWPFYSIVLAIVSHVFHLSLLHSGYLLNYIFSVLTVLIFIKIVKELGGTTKLLWIAALVMLAYIDFNHFRADILRDNGYWFFYLLSVFYLFRFIQNTRCIYAILWGFSILIGALFRIEGAIFFLLAPFIIFLFKDMSFFQKLKSYFKLNVVLIALALVMSAVFMSHLTQGYHSEKLSDSFSQVISGVSTIYYSLNSMWLNTKLHVIGPLAVNESANFVFFGLFGLYVYSVLALISLGYFIAAIYAQLKKVNPGFGNNRLILFWCIFINLLVTSAFFLQNQGFLSDRYIIPLALTFMIFVPFGLSYLYERWQECPKKWNGNNILFWFVCLTIIWMAVGSLWRFGPSKIYIYKSARWIRKNTPQDSKVYTNHTVLGTLVERKSGGFTPTYSVYFTYQKISQRPWSGYNYAIFITSSGDKKYVSQIEKTMKQKPIEVYYDNHRRDQAYIFKITRKK